MNKPHTPIRKTCSACGIEKPLTAFLQMSGVDGTTYTNICNDCRKAGLDKAHPKDTEETTRSTTTITIDSKSKVKSEVDKREARKEKETRDLEEKSEKEELTLEKTDKIETIAKHEKKHRDTFLQNSSFLTAKPKSDTKTVTEAKRKTEQAAQQAHGVEQITHKEAAAKHEQKEKEIDYANGPFQDTQIAGKEKFTKGITAKEGIVAKEGILAKNKMASWASPISTFNQPSASKKSDQKILSDYIEETMGPGPKRK